MRQGFRGFSGRAFHEHNEPRPIAARVCVPSKGESFPRKGLSAFPPFGLFHGCVALAFVLNRLVPVTRLKSQGIVYRA
jgi:hypothetical protein